MKYFESAANLKMQNEKYTFIFILNIENMESALPLNEKLKNCGLIYMYNANEKGAAVAKW